MLFDDSTCASSLLSFVFFDAKSRTQYLWMQNNEFFDISICADVQISDNVT